MFKKRWTIFVFAFLGWLMIGIAHGLNEYFFTDTLAYYYKEAPTLKSMLLWEVVYWPTWAALAPLIFLLARRFPIVHENWLRNLLINIAGGLLIIIPQRLIYLTAAGTLQSVLGEEIMLSGLYRHFLLYNLPTGFLSYGVILLFSHGFNYYKRYQEEELKASELKAELAEAQLQITRAELQSLKMQLHPHFLFNTLNSISALLDEDAHAADEMLARLGDFLRLTLENSGAQTIALQEELEFLRRYLEIEQVRFQDRLTVGFAIDAETLAAQVPNMILQPIIENAIRHGIVERIAEGHIEITARRENDKLLLQVKDNGAGLQSPAISNGQGLGLSNTRARLQQIYGAAHRFELENASEGGTIARLEIPFILDEGSKIAV